MKLWQTDNGLDKEVEEFTIGVDYLYDQKLVEYDCKVSMAHSKLLLKMKIITKKEHNELNSELKSIIQLYKNGKFKIKQSDEDVHTKIENWITKKLGKTGKKIHALRSRNDQVIATLRLYSKDKLLETKKEAQNFIQDLTAFGKKTKGTPMPGYTHMQRAMPSSVALWAESFKESLQSDIKILDFAIDTIDENPLGSAAGFGLPIKIDKTITTKALGFSKCFQNPIYVQNSRAKNDLKIVFSLLQTMLTLNKLATDLLLFTTKEFGFFSLPKSMCTGSSIMPQKKNYDVLEILRANIGIVSSNFYFICTNAANLQSGYNRDVQLNKGKVMQSFEITTSSLIMARKIIENLEIDKNSLKKATSEELYAAEKAIKMSLGGTPFRDAYKIVSKQSSRK